MKKIYLFLFVGIFLLPSILISQTFTLAGTVERHNGSPVEGVEVRWGNTSITTDVSGNYALTSIPINDPIGLSASGTFDYFEEITILDLLVLRNHLLGIEVLDFPNWIQGDLSGDSGISGLDIVLLTQLALHMDNTFFPNNPNYRFCYGEASSTCMDPSVQAVPDTIIIYDIVALRDGDVAIIADHLPPPPVAPSPVIGITKADFLAGDMVQIEVKIEDAKGVAGVQQTFEWDPSLLEFESILGFNGFEPQVNNLEIGQGKLPVLSSSNFLFGLPEETTLYTLNFIALADAPSYGDYLFVSDELTPPQMVWQNPDDYDYFVVEGEYESIEGSVKVQDILSLESFEIFPNPAHDIMNVNVLLQNAEPMEMKIVNALGQAVFSQKNNQKELNLEIDLKGFASGIYFLSLQTKNGIRTESFLKK